MSDSTEKADQEPAAVAEQAAEQPPPDIEEVDNDQSELSAQLAAALEELEENNNKYIRLVAESENVRKRTMREVERARKFGIERFAAELLTVVDSLEMGIDMADGASAQALLEGKQATLKLMISVLAKSGIEPLDPEGEPFDPNLHEAMTMQSTEAAEPGSVLTVVQKGYQLNGRLLRPARVIVASEPGA
ncbi:MAG: nucleotide exchange factor GrpE [Gammaproteobacteria bacterium]|jgi:molecular chaperone GrpE|nr:nucleotide exchange factor GrpE [Chromatiales bacterium]MCP4925446.1 nucleotide exchange factor GrpE [Gammaproteobacteria bacterium]MDP7297406.1 nucleotide exchange factor GrpE [Gammaproteobacteria bacterium]MDP7419952.1 nucleotide exchange factor GrpE [Gammaproteobacteria bacterium]MDP7660952.1 nucleotide exchange factor GrpE [Gammaproteobacteria bacterium]